MKLKLGVIFVGGIYNLRFIGGSGLEAYISFLQKPIDWKFLIDNNEEKLRVVFIKRMLRFTCGKS